jgi:CRP-like cAMP-binding protein
MSHSHDPSNDSRLRQRIATEWGLDVATVDTLLQAATVRRFDAGASIIPQGSARSTVFIILEGQVSLSVLLPNGRRILCTLYHPGAIFGFPIVETERPRWSAAEAYTDTTVALVVRRDFERIIAALSPQAVMQFFNKILVRQAKFAMRLLHCMVLDLRGRVALTLLDLGETFGVAEGEHLHIQVPVTHEHLAEMVGASRERVSKAMASLEADRLLRYRRRAITLIDTKALREVATPAD